MSLENPTTPQLSRPEKSQAELRLSLEQKLNSLKSDLDLGIEEYQQALKGGLFEDREEVPDDQEEDEEGAGEKRKQAMQNRLNSLIKRAQKTKATLDSNEELPQPSQELSVDYTLPDGSIETITLSIEQKLQEFISFYQKTNLDLPPTFETDIQEIWSDNQAEIELAIQENGFDDLLIIPGNIPLPELADKMKMENGYFEGSNFTTGGSFAGAVSKGVDKTRIILYHNTTLPEIQQKTGIDVHLNITLEDADKLYQQHPDYYLATLEDHLILERYHFEDTGEHISDYTKNSGHLLPGTTSGARRVRSVWRPSDGGLGVVADALGSQGPRVGFRLSRSFEKK